MERLLEKVSPILELALGAIGVGSTPEREDSWRRLNEEHCYERTFEGVAGTTHTCQFELCTETLRCVTSAFLSEATHGSTSNGFKGEYRTVTMALRDERGSLGAFRFVSDRVLSCLRRRLRFVLVAVMAFPSNLDVVFLRQESDVFVTLTWK